MRAARRSETPSAQVDAVASSYRIVLADLDPLIHGMVDDAIERQRDMSVVARVPALAALADAAYAAEPDAVIVGLRTRELPDECRQLMRDRPHAVVLGIAVGGFARLYVLTERELSEASPDEMLQAIRDAAPRPSLT